MQKVLDDVSEFYESRPDTYHAYRRGYILYSPPGTGKSSIVEIIAQTHIRAVYSIQLNNANMNDTVLVNLCQSVPPYSLTVFDEFDKQYERTINDNRDYVCVTKGGILSAIDGVPRLPDGVVIVFTCNTLDVLDDIYRSQLCRPGRIDTVYQLYESFC